MRGQSTALLTAAALVIHVHCATPPSPNTLDLPLTRCRSLRLASTLPFCSLDPRIS